MAEHIEREKAIGFVKQYTPHIDGETTMQCVKTALENVPTADVVKVVRCKDCVIGITNTAKMGAGWYWCKNNQQYHKSDHYCGYGELKEREGNDVIEW